MSDSQPPVAAPTTEALPPGQPQPDSVHWPVEDVVIVIGPPAADLRSRKEVVVPVTFTVKLAPSLHLTETVTLALLYVVNGSLNYSALFSQVEVSTHSKITFPPGVTTAQVVLHTLPLAPGATFDLEVVAYPASAEGVIAIPPGQVSAEDKSLTALNVLATTALVTALGALAFALLKPRT